MEKRLNKGQWVSGAARAAPETLRREKIGVWQGPSRCSILSSDILEPKTLTRGGEKVTQKSDKKSGHNGD